MNLDFSIIIPVYNRPQEIEEVLHSLTQQDFKDNFEVIIVEDGSTEKVDEIVKKFRKQLNIHYFFKENTGAGFSRNFGMEKARGNYFIILDSDVLLPQHYLSSVKKQLTENFTDAYGGPDKAHESFTNLQKAINYSMTSILTTGGIRGKKKAVGKFQPRSFNMGLSKKAFESTKGYSAMKAGEDIDLTFRLWENGFETQLIDEAYVYHKRRTSISQFFKQTFAFGTARPILNNKYPSTKKLTYWFPSLFVIGLILAIIFNFWGYSQLLSIFIGYFIALTIYSTIENKNLVVGLLSIITSIVQFFGYGLGFLKSFLKIS